MPFILVRLPADYFISDNRKSLLKTLPFPLNYILIGFKNVVGFILVLYGIVLLFIPGQGILTIIAALALMNFPGKRKLIYVLISRKTVLGGINWIRRRAGREDIKV